MELGVANFRCAQVRLTNLKRVGRDVFAFINIDQNDDDLKIWRSWSTYNSMGSIVKYCLRRKKKEHPSSCRWNNEIKWDVYLSIPCYIFWYDFSYKFIHNVLTSLFLANCKDPGTPRNGARTGDNFEHGQTVSFTCNNGYTLIGRKSMDCRKGVWSSSLPQCKSKLTKCEMTIICWFYIIFCI